MVPVDAAPIDGPPVADGPWIAVREVMSPAAAVVSATAPLRAAVAEALRTGSDRVWLTGPGGRLCGALTDLALLRAEITGVRAERPAAELSEPAVPLAGGGDSAAAVVRLGRGGEPRVAVVEDGRLIGELTRRDVLGLVYGVRRVANAVAVPVAAPAAATAERGPAAPRFLSRRGSRAERVSS